MDADQYRSLASADRRIPHRLESVRAVIRPSPGASRHPLPVGEGMNCNIVPLPLGEGGAKRRVRVAGLDLLNQDIQAVVAGVEDNGVGFDFGVIASDLDDVGAGGKRSGNELRLTVK